MSEIIKQSSIPLNREIASKAVSAAIQIQNAEADPGTVNIHTSILSAALGDATTVGLRAQPSPDVHAIVDMYAHVKEDSQGHSRLFLDIAHNLSGEDRLKFLLILAGSMAPDIAGQSQIHVGLGEFSMAMAERIKKMEDPKLSLDAFNQAYGSLLHLQSAQQDVQIAEMIELHSIGVFQKEFEDKMPVHIVESRVAFQILASEIELRKTSITPKEMDDIYPYIGAIPVSVPAGSRVEST